MADNEIRREVEESGIDSTQPIVEEGSTTVEQIKTPWWKKVWGWIVGVIKPIVKIVCDSLDATVLYVINDAENQALAQSAIKQVAAQGLKGTEAFKAALAIIKAGKINLSATEYIAAGKVPTNILETLVQLVYTCIKNKLKNG